MFIIEMGTSLSPSVHVLTLVLNALTDNLEEQKRKMFMFERGTCLPPPPTTTTICICVLTLVLIIINRGAGGEEEEGDIHV